MRRASQSKDGWQVWRRDGRGGGEEIATRDWDRLADRRALVAGDGDHDGNHKTASRDWNALSGRQVVVPVRSASNARWNIRPVGLDSLLLEDDVKAVVVTHIGPTRNAQNYFIDLMTEDRFFHSGPCLVEKCPQHVWNTFRGLPYDVCEWIVSLKVDDHPFWGPSALCLLDWMNREDAREDDLWILDSYRQAGLAASSKALQRCIVYFVQL